MASMDAAVDDGGGGTDISDDGTNHGGVGCSFWGKTPCLNASVPWSTRTFSICLIVAEHAVVSTQATTLLACCLAEISAWLPRMAGVKT